MRSLQNWNKGDLYVILNYSTIIAIIYFVFFQRLGSNHIRPWDESMYAVNAFEMYYNHHFFVPYYKGVPDFWNLKPPLQIWAQVFFIKLIGFNETAIRLPSASAMAMTSLIIFFYAKAKHSLKFAWCVFLVFVTSSGLTDVHMSRTGDADALLSLFVLLSVLSYYNFIVGDNPKGIIIFFIYLFLALITKSVASLLVIPAMIVFTIIQKKLKLLFYNPWFYFCLIAFIMFAAAIFGARENGNPGYLKALYESDILRLESVRRSPNELFQFYFNNFFEKRFLWLWLILPGYILMRRNIALKSFVDYLFLVVICYFLIISSSITKFEWYDMPLYPFMALICAYPIFLLINNLIENRTSSFAILGAYSVIFAIPLYFSFRKAQKDEIPFDQKKLERLYKYAYQVAHGKIPIKNITYLNANFDRPLQFYKYMTLDKGFKIDIVNDVIGLGSGLNVAVSDEYLESLLKQKFELKEIEKYEGVTVYHTIKLKE